jgi:queuine/archaeosine tRNA-ribosyltransferase
MFKLKETNFGCREGKIISNKKVVDTPCFFATSDFGGGGTNVARLLAYSDILSKSDIQVLMNYYYLDINSGMSPRFDTSLIKKFASMGDIIDFIQEVKREYVSNLPKKVISNYNLTKDKWQPMTLLDSGSGNILRNKIKNKTLTPKNYRIEYDKIVKEFFNFMRQHKFDLGIAMDFASKNTFKAGELRDKDYIEGIEFFLNKNFDLLDISLRELKNYPNLEIYVPLHGENLEEYSSCLKSVLDLEDREKISFAGFAIGGIGNPSIVSKEKWGIPSEVNGKVKAMIYLYELTNSIRRELEKRKDTRPIHILGAASPYNLIPLLIAGADSFDCHSAWRRSSDGNSESKKAVSISIESSPKDIAKDANFSKILIPLLDKDGQVITKNKDNFLEFIELHKVNKDNFDCNCNICSKYNLDVIKKLYSGTTEENYFAKILIYSHSINQYPLISKKMSKMKRVDVQRFLDSLPTCPFKININEFLSYLKKD